MEPPRIRKYQVTTERVLHAGGDDFAEPNWRGSVTAVVDNPFAGTHQAELIEFMEALAPLGEQMAVELRDALVGDGRHIEGYGKGAIVGTNGELELAAVWHVPGGAGLRAALGHPKAMVAASKKVGPIGCQLDIPTVHLHASYLRSHYDVVPVSIHDGPKPDEIAYCLVMTAGERPGARIGGFTIDEVQGDDGLY